MYRVDLLVRTSNNKQVLLIIIRVESHTVWSLLVCEPRQTFT